MPKIPFFFMKGTGWIMSNLKEKLHLHIGRKTKSQKIIIAFILNNLEDAAFMNIVELSRNSGVSTSTITRFCGNLGYERFPLFQKMLQSELMERYKDNNKEENPVNVLEKMLNNDLKQLNKMKDFFSCSSFPYIQKLIFNTDKLIVGGFGEAAFIAKRFCNKLTKLKKNVFLFTEFTDFEKQQFIFLHENAVVIMFCFDDECVESRKFYNAAENYNMKFICVSENKLHYCEGIDNEYVHIPTGGEDIFTYGIFFINEFINALIEKECSIVKLEDNMVNSLSFKNKYKLRLVK